ncbi:GNAT family N-acetyltransferase [Enterococcus alcedinis]
MLEREILQYAVDNFSDVNGLGIAVNQKDSHTLDLLKEYGFEKNDNNENILEKLFEENGFDYTLPVGIRIKELDVNQDLYKQHSVLWHGFENEGDLPLDQTTLDKQSRMLSAPSLNSYLHLVAVNEENDFVAYCGCWYHPQTDYAYVEPVCTIPNYRKKGLGKALVLEALKRSQSAGAEKAYVISDSPFYKNMGFMQHSNYSFYWKK